MLVSIPPKTSVSAFMGYLKGKSSLMIFDRHANLKYKYGNRQFGCKGYYVDIASDQISLKEYVALFTGEAVKKANKRASLEVA